jgi:agmatinase
MRVESAKLSELENFPYGFDPVVARRIVDCGDVAFDTNRTDTVVPTIEEAASEILAAGARLLSLGGDHFMTYPLLRAHADRHGAPLSLVQLDAHTDTWPDDGVRLDHGTMIRRAAVEGIVDPTVSCQVGVRTWNDDPMGFDVIDAPWLHEAGEAATVERVLERVGDRPCYVTFDIDCIDPGFAPGTGTPVAGGLSSAQALTIWRSLCPQLHLVGADVAEVSPPFDVAGVTALLAATLAHDLLCMWPLDR